MPQAGPGARQQHQTAQKILPHSYWCLNSLEIFTEHKEPEVPLVLPW